MINPLTLYVPLKQDATTQATAAALVAGFQSGQPMLPPNPGKLHFVRIAGVPNLLNTSEETTGLAGVLIITTFDGPMEPYLNYFYGQTAIMVGFQDIFSLTPNPPSFPVTFQQFSELINTYNLNAAGSLSYAYSATAAQIAAKFPLSVIPPVSISEINPLTFYIAIKQDTATQTIAQDLVKIKQSGQQIPQPNLGKIHFSRVAGVPNPPNDQGVITGLAGILLINVFDGPIEPYLNFFFNEQETIKEFNFIFSLSPNPPASPVTFEQFSSTINNCNLNAAGSLSYAYSATEAQILAKFPI